jgi:hypothetical protein
MPNNRFSLFFLRVPLSKREEVNVTENARWIAALRNRDQAAMEEIYDCYFQLLWNITYAKLGNVPSCEKILSHVFKDLWENFHLYNEEAQLSHLLIKSCLSNIEQLQTTIINE